MTIIVASYLWGIISGSKVKFYGAKDILLMALFNSVGVIFLYISISLLSPVTIGFLGRFYTVFAVVLAVIFLKEKLTRKEIVLIMFALIGIFLFVDKGDTDETTVLGIINAILYTFFFALTNIFIKKNSS